MTLNFMIVCRKFRSDAFEGNRNFHFHVNLRFTTHWKSVDRSVFIFWFSLTQSKSVITKPNLHFKLIPKVCIVYLSIITTNLTVALHPNSFISCILSFIRQLIFR